MAFKLPGQGRDLRERRPVAGSWAKAAADALEAVLRLGVDLWIVWLKQ